MPRAQSALAKEIDRILKTGGDLNDLLCSHEWQDGGFGKPCSDCGTTIKVEYSLSGGGPIPLNTTGYFCRKCKKERIKHFMKHAKALPYGYKIQSE